SAHTIWRSCCWEYADSVASFGPEIRPRAVDPIPSQFDFRGNRVSIIYNHYCLWKGETTFIGTCKVWISRIVSYCSTFWISDPDNGQRRPYFPVIGSKRC